MLTRFFGGIFSLIMAALVFAVPCFLVWLDLYLGPQFMTAYIDSTGLYSGRLAQLIPWTFSIATTGFQYMLFVSLRGGAKFRGSNGEAKLALSLGWTVLVLDTAIDVGGFTSLAYDNPQMGMQIWPDDPNMGWGFLAILIIIGCGLQEFILSPMLAQKKGEKPFSFLPGAKMISVSLGAISMLYGWFCGAARGVAMVSVLALDVFLTYYFIQSKFGADGQQLVGAFQAVAWFLSLILTVGQFMVYWQYKRQKANGGGGGGKKKINSWLLCGILLTIVDTAMDIGGFTIMMYGPNQSGMGLFPDDPSLAWWILALIILAMCMLYESLMETAFENGLGKTVKGM